MRIDKQLALKKILESGQYIIDSDNGVILNKSEKRLKGALLPSGYIQVSLSNGKRNRKAGDNKNVQGIFYVHQIVFFSLNGFYDESKVINHIDSNPQNNRASNLELVTQSDNIKKSTYGMNDVVFEQRLIRDKEIAQIRDLMAQNLSQSAIAKQLNLNRCSVRRTMKKIESGEKLKYDELPTVSINKRTVVIQGDEIRRIRQFMIDGYNAHQISKILNRPYTSISGYIKKIKDGKTLKFETLIPQNQRFNGGMYYH